MQDKKLKGRIHSTESFGTVDGPGVRFVIFFQGCPMRCLYCHNPDSWDPNGGQEMTVKEILTMYEGNLSYYKSGGITATGGEPLMQLPFLTQLFKVAKQRGIHTCLDTSGITYNPKRKEDFEELFKYVDLVLLDFKHSEDEGHKKLTLHSLKNVLEFARALEKQEIPMIIRHVVVPGITDDKAHLYNIGRLIGEFRNLKGLEVLPYHTMGKVKYESMGLKYPLEDIKDMEKDSAYEFRKYIIEGIKAAKNIKYRTDS